MAGGGVITRDLLAWLALNCAIIIGGTIVIATGLFWQQAWRKRKVRQRRRRDKDESS